MRLIILVGLNSSGLLTMYCNPFGQEASTLLKGNIQIIYLPTKLGYLAGQWYLMFYLCRHLMCINQAPPKFNFSSCQSIDLEIQVFQAPGPTYLGNSITIIITCRVGDSVSSWSDPFDAPGYCLASDFSFSLICGTAHNGRAQLWDKRVPTGVQVRICRQVI